MRDRLSHDATICDPEGWHAAVDMWLFAYALRFRIGTSGSPNASTSTSWRTDCGFSPALDDDDDVTPIGDLTAEAAFRR